MSGTDSVSERAPTELQVTERAAGGVFPHDSLKPTMLIYGDRSEALAGKYEREAKKHWDRFFRRNGERFFRDRHYLTEEFPSLAGRVRVFEAGCGAGNAAVPLLLANPSATAFCCDLSLRAVELTRDRASRAGVVRSLLHCPLRGAPPPDEPLLPSAGGEIDGYAGRHWRMG